MSQRNLILVHRGKNYEQDFAEIAGKVVKVTARTGETVVKGQLLAQIDPLLAVSGCWLAHVVSRTTPLFIIRTLPHVGDTPRSKSKPLADRIGLASLLAGLLWCAAALALAGWFGPVPLWLAGLAGAAAGLWWMRRLLACRLQGFTGDGLGATQQVCEVMFLLGVALASGWPA